MDKEDFKTHAIFYANWTGHSSFPRFYGVIDVFTRSLTEEEKSIMTEQGFFDYSTENGRRLERAVRNTMGKDKVDDDFFKMVEDALAIENSKGSQNN